MTLYQATTRTDRLKYLFNLFRLVQAASELVSLVSLDVLVGLVKYRESAELVI